MELKSRFEQAAKDVLGLNYTPDNSAKLSLYALYKQASQGDVQGSRPGMFDMVNRAKYDAWAKLKGLTQDQAMQDYIDLVQGLIEKNN